MEEQFKSLVVPEEYQDTVLGNYLHTVHYLDQAIGNFIDELKKEELYDSSAIIIYGDHQGLDMRNEETNQRVSRFF